MQAPLFSIITGLSSLACISSGVFCSLAFLVKSIFVRFSNAGPAMVFVCLRRSSRLYLNESHGVYNPPFPLTMVSRVLASTVPPFPAVEPFRVPWILGVTFFLPWRRHILSANYHLVLASVFISLGAGCSQPQTLRYLTSLGVFGRFIDSPPFTAFQPVMLVRRRASQRTPFCLASTCFPPSSKTSHATCLDILFWCPFLSLFPTPFLLFYDAF